MILYDIFICSFTGKMHSNNGIQSLVCCFNDTSLSPAALAEATVIVKATQANELKAFETILVIAECW